MSVSSHLYLASIPIDPCKRCEDMKVESDNELCQACRTNLQIVQDLIQQVRALGKRVAERDKQHEEASDLVMRFQERYTRAHMEAERLASVNETLERIITEAALQRP